MLLDTHVCLWLLISPERISATVRADMAAAPLLLVSAVSVAEVEIKRMTGKLDAPPEFIEAMTTSGVGHLPLSAAHARALRDLPDLARHDPFDRLLLAQAVTEDVRFLTADRRLLALGDPRIVDARAQEQLSRADARESGLRAGRRGAPPAGSA